MAALLQQGVYITCPHGGRGVVTPTQTENKIDGKPMLTSDDPVSIIGCPFNISGSPHPCVKGVWEGSTDKGKVNGKQMVTSSSRLRCVAADQAVQGYAAISGAQSKATI